MNDKISDHSAAYDFVRLGEGLADSLTRAAEEHVTKAQQILDQTKSMAEIIRTQVRAQAKQIEAMNGRFKAFGEQMLDAHRKLNEAGDYSVQEAAAAERLDRGLKPNSLSPGNKGLGEQGTAALKPAPTPDLARLRALDALKHDRDLPAGSSTFSPNPGGSKRDPDANYPAGAGGFPGSLADIEFLRVNRAGVSENRRDPGFGTRQPDRD
jgi:hypothetical protein